jgi:hypothetical protein
MASKTTAKAGGKSQSSAGKGKRRPSGKPVPVKQPKPWGWIAASAVIGVIVVLVLGYCIKLVVDNGKPWEDRANAIPGIVNYREKDPALVKQREHQAGSLKYAQSPPVAGNHNGVWQNCMGDVYDAPIPNEHAVHSLEHGAVWVTYKPDLPKDQVKLLADRVKGKEKLFMSPYTGLDKNVSLQAWGYQLKVDNANDPRIDDFIKALRVNASLEGSTALCSGGNSTTGTKPQDSAQSNQPMPKS